MADLKERIEALNGAASLSYKSAAAVGAIVTLVYLFGINHFPSGLTPGEVVFFVFVALAFGFLCAVFLLYGAFSMLWVAQLMTYGTRLLRFKGAPPWRRRSGGQRQAMPECRGLKSCWHRLRTWFLTKGISLRLGVTRAARRRVSLFPKETGGWLLGVASCTVFAVFLWAYLAVQNEDARLLLLSAWMAGFVMLMLNGEDGRQKHGQKPIWMILKIVAPVFVFLMIGHPKHLVEMVFQKLGIRADGVIIEVPETDMQIFERVSETMGRPLVDCRRGAGGRLFVHGASVLWSGIGEQTVLAFNGHKSDDPEKHGASRQVTLSLATKDIRIIKSRPSPGFCFDLPADMSFETGRYDLTAAAEDQLNGLVALIKEAGEPTQIVVRGHSDPRVITGRLVGGVGDNQRLSELRASAVAEAIRSRIGSEKLVIRSEGVGSMEPKVDCRTTATTSRYELDQCHKQNRRVEVRIRLDQSGAKTEQ